MAADNAASLSPSPPTDEDIFKLVYINGLILLALLVLFLLHVLGSLRRRSSHKLLHAVVLGAYTLSYALVSYTLGLMQSSTYFFNEFPVWAVCLLMLLGGTDNLMACKLNDVDDWKSYHVKHFLKGVLVVYIVAAYTNNNSPTEPYDYDVSKDATQYRWPLWAILFVNVFQSCMRINSMKMASKSNLLAKNVKPIVDHMKDEGNQPLVSAETERGRPDGKQPELGCRYIVAGEHRLRNIGKLPMESSTKKKKMEEMKITTVEDIWRSKGSLLRSESKRGMRLKDICLSMALSKMLNRRFAGFEILEAELPNAREFVLNGLLIEAGRDKPYQDMPYERMFRVIEVELGFVYDLYYTRYPYLYNKVRHFALCLPIAMVSFCSWLTYVIFKKHKEAGEKDNISLCTTLFLMSVVTFLEAFQLYLHLASNWFKVALIRSYVLLKKPKETGDNTPSSQGSSSFSVRSMIISLALRFKTLRPWENKLGQYCLLQNYDGTRHTSNLIHYVTLWLVDRAKKGCKRGKLVKLSTDVKKAVIDSLIGSEGHLTNGSRSLKKNGARKLLPWVRDTSDKKVTQTLLVWHIATTICKHKFDAALPKDGKKTAVFSGEEDNGVVLTACSLSQYCAYLIAFAPDLLPGHSFDSASILEKCIQELRSLTPPQGAKTMEEKCQMLMTTPLQDARTTEEKFEILMSNSDTNSEDPSIVIKLGALLATELMDIDNRWQVWQVLSDFWAEMVLYIAPCDDAKARAHLEALPRGGEFITHLWALLTHAGMLKRAPPPTGSEARMLECAPTGLEAV